MQISLVQTDSFGIMDSIDMALGFVRIESGIPNSDDVLAVCLKAEKEIPYVGKYLSNTVTEMNGTYSIIMEYEDYFDNEEIDCLTLILTHPLSNE